MYKITLSLSNPLTGDSEVTTYQFNPATFDQTEWAAGFPLVQEMLAKLTARSTPIEPSRWTDAAMAAKPSPASP